MIAETTIHLWWWALSLLLAAGSAVVGTSRAGGAEPRQPNVILILVDDMGWRDVGFMGNTFVETPAIDALATGGLVFNQAYSSAPNCAPTRACLMSGQVPPRHGVYTVVDPRQPPGSPWHKLLAAESNSDLATDVVTIPEVLGEAGYATAFFGMWNLGRGRRGPTTPGGQGFDTVVFPENLGFAKDAYHDDDGNYLSDRLADELIAFVERQRDRPFFAYFADHAVHAPYDPPADLLAKYQRKASAGRDRRDNAAYAATIEGVDRNVARIVAALDRLALREETILIFTSDNGGTPRFTPPLRGSKGELYEGGIRVPLAVSWPGRVKPGATDFPVATVDVYPTLLEICGAPAPAGQPLDGVSLAGLLLGGQEPRRDRLFWHFPCYVGRATPSSAVREENWKLVEFFEDGGHVELYDLATDPHEERNLAQREPKRTEMLAATLRQWQRATGAALPAGPNPAYDVAAERPRGGEDGRARGSGGRQEEQRGKSGRSERSPPAVGVDFALGGGSVLSLATVAEGADVLGAEDDYTRRMSPFDRQARLKSREPVGDAQLRAFSRRAVLPWSERERAAVARAIEGLASRMDALGVSLPPRVLLVKTSGDEEGGAAYTRGTAVVLPVGVLEKPQATLRRLLCHELFHVLSRSRPDLRDQLYESIGFEPCGEVTLPEDLESLRITNPDAPTSAHAIRVSVDGGERTVVPILYSRSPYDPARGASFFATMEFRLMAVRLESDPPRAVADLDDSGRPKLSTPDDVKGFHEQVGRNTGYIIHPEEILADNFSILVLGGGAPANPEIVTRMGEILHDDAKARGHSGR